MAKGGGGEGEGKNEGKIYETWKNMERTQQWDSVTNEIESQRIRNDLIKTFLDPQYLDNIGKALL